ncbi:hypothetical protein [Pseudomonas protegens]|uniref:hypothetical protein n=1 Tax=Pseudomonas protegens TaxID=380021 RepID=UPI000F4657FC|nr:hypothetical protein [Pseudomonas protegens]ROL93208.1 hypothetical protein BK639_11750 [Pseudomonas protegens]ROL99380.1 hypothetical protein BK641_21715 [Pseudomonas protegens]ROM05393.1 hypothetical protein BK640_11935 [Pseudomonas protegens]ROM11868.1 hypothetical protein BK642_10580 [Pseudomonas protegens]
MNTATQSDAPSDEESTGQLISAASRQRELKKPYDYIVNEKDNDGECIEKIYSKLPEFVVYRTKNAIRIDINDDHERAKEIMSCHMKISVDLGRIYSWLPEQLSDSEPVNKQIARAMTANASGHYDKAQLLLKHAEERILKTKTLKGRLEYTVSALKLVFVTVVVLLATTFYIESDDIKTFLYVILCGSLGGLLSTSIGFSTLEIDLDADRRTNVLIGQSRILIAVTAAVFSYFAIKSEIAFTFIAKSPEHYGIYMIAMMSGFVELLIPNMMNNLARSDKTSKPE